MKAEYDFSWNLRRELAALLIEKGVAPDCADDAAIVILNKVNKDIDDVLRKVGDKINSDDDSYIRW